MGTIERINKEAALEAPNSGSEMCYIKGAISERNKTIDEVKAAYFTYVNTPFKDPEKAFYEILESLKIDLKG